MSDSVTLWTVARLAPLSMEFSPKEYWSVLPHPSSGALPDPGIKPSSLLSPALASWVFTPGTSWEAHTWARVIIKNANQHTTASWPTCIRVSISTRNIVQSPYSTWPPHASPSPSSATLTLTCCPPAVWLFLFLRPTEMVPASNCCSDSALDMHSTSHPILRSQQDTVPSEGVPITLAPSSALFDSAVTKEQWKCKLPSRVRLFATPWTAESMEFSRPECWSGQPFPSPGDLPNPGIKPRSPALQADSWPADSTWPLLFLSLKQLTMTLFEDCLLVHVASCL